MESSYSHRKASPRRQEKGVPPPLASSHQAPPAPPLTADSPAGVPRGSHNRPWHAEEEYRKSLISHRVDQERRSTITSSSKEALNTTTSSSSSSSLLPSSSSYARYLEQKQRGDDTTAQPPKSPIRENKSSSSKSSGKQEKKHHHHRNVVEEVAASLRNPSSTSPSKERGKLQLSALTSSGQAAAAADSSLNTGMRRSSTTTRSSTTAEDNTSNNDSTKNLSSRELRARRLRQQQEERTAYSAGNRAATGSSSGTGTPSCLLLLQKLETSGSTAATGATTSRRIPQDPPAVCISKQHPLSSQPSSDQQHKNYGRPSSTGTTSGSNRPSSYLEESAARREQLASRAAARESSSPVVAAASPLSSTSSAAAAVRGSSTTNTSSTRGPTVASSNTASSKVSSSNNNTAAAAAVTSSSAKGWSTLSTAGRKNRSVSMTSAGSGSGGIIGSSNNSHNKNDSTKVNQYLAQRNVYSAPPLPGQNKPVVVPRLALSSASSDAASSTLNMLRLKAAGSRDEDDDSISEGGVDEGSTSHLSVSEEEDEDWDNSHDEYDDPAIAGGGDVPEWSVRVSVVSGVDFPAPVVPNLPLSPVLRLGLVPLDHADRVACGKLQSMGSKARIQSTSAKVLAKRDNGSVEFHEEFRWDRVRFPENLALVVQLDSRAVLTPQNCKESPLAVAVPLSTAATTNSAGPRAATRPSSATITTASEDISGISSGIGSLFRRPTTKKTANEMETAHAAAAVAKLLVEGTSKDDTTSSSTSQPAGPLFDSRATNLRNISSSSNNQSEVDVKLRPRKRRRNAKMTPDLFLGSQTIPLSTLSLEKAMNDKESARIEQWFELKSSNDNHDGQQQQYSRSSITSSSSPGSASVTKRSPTVLLEITFSSPVVRDESEDEMDEGGGSNRLKASFAKRASQQIRSQLKDEVAAEPSKQDEEPELVPGVIDFVCVVGARDIGDQKSDDGSSGWVNSTPECCVLEQFPDDQFHAANGRSCVLPNKVEWFCFPEGCRLWRGTTPPNLDELNLKRFSASSPANISTSIASFDACFGCTTSFSWFVISSHSESYGSETSKTFGVVIRFFVPAPTGIDPTQDDFAQTFIDGSVSEIGDRPEGKRLWVPIGICLTSSLPIVGTMEAILLRLCESLAAKGITSCPTFEKPSKLVHMELANLICGYQRPIRGAVHCSIPFLREENFHLALPPPGGLPALPHGNAVASVCRLLGADGFLHMLAAVLTECKILIHSDDIANLCLVSEVIFALIYPFLWSLPYIPVLPLEMMEFIEAPLSYLLGIPSCNLKLIDPDLLEDVVVVDLDKDFPSSDYFDGTQPTLKSKTPIPLPATVAGNLSRAVYRLLRAEENAEEESLGVGIPTTRAFPRLEPESAAEREFRVAVAKEMCGLVRGYQDCLVYASSSQPVFNVDRFLQIAPALFEEQRGTSSESGEEFSHHVLSPRSRRFMSILVNCQLFHQFLEILGSDQAAFFHEVISTVHTDNVARRLPKRTGHVLSLDFQKNMDTLCSFLQKLENKIPTYRVQRIITAPDLDDQLARLDIEETTPGARFPRDLLQQIIISMDSNSAPGSPDQGEGVKHVSIEYLMELEKNPWRYQQLFGINFQEGISVKSFYTKVKLRDAIGERRYRAWKLAIEQEKFDYDDMSVFSEDSKTRDGNLTLDLGSLITSAASDVSSPSIDAPGSGGHLDSSQEATMTATKRRLADAKDRETLRRCLEWALTSGNGESQARDRDLLAESEIALRNPSARKFLLSVLNQRSAQQVGADPKGRRRSSAGASKLDSAAFDILLRLGCAMLDACMEALDYDSAYDVLKLTAGIYTITGENDHDVAVAYMTEQMGLHPIYADLGIWERANDLHLSARKDDKDGGTSANGSQAVEEEDEYEAAVATLYEMLGYGIPAEEMARFASRVSDSKGWFKSERGHTLMLLSRRLSSRREQGGGGASSPSKKSDLELMSPVSRSTADKSRRIDRCQGKTAKDARKLAPIKGDDSFTWIETGWCHPAAQSSRRLAVAETNRRPGTQSLLNMLDEQKNLPDSIRQNPKLMKRSAVTSMAYLGSSVVVTGGLDGGVFMARKVRTSDNEKSSAQEGFDKSGVKGVHLDWGSSGSRYTVASASGSLDGEYGVGAVSCLATTCSLSTYSALNSESSGSAKDATDPLIEEDLLVAMEGCRVVAGTTCGDLRVWTVKDVFSAVFYSTGDRLSSNPVDKGFTHRTGEGASSKFVTTKRRSATDFSAGSSLTRLKFSLRGRALSGHRGGVSCIDVPSSIYRPDSIISGGADGLIKLWNLRSPGSLGSRRTDLDAASPVTDGLSPRAKAASNGDALCILSGHGGRILCIKTAWHGDRLLSGGADRTVRVWDLAGGSGKCLLSMSGHLGWVTHVRYWGPNTVISASTDRSISLWDSRVRNTPLFSLRHHHAPVSDILVGVRTDPIMFSAANDGTVAAWDFRLLSGSGDTNPQAAHDEGEKRKIRCHSVRDPPGRLHLRDHCKPSVASGSVLLSRGPSRERATVMCVGRDGILREWDYCQDEIVSDHTTGHCDLVSTFASIQGGRLFDTSLESGLEQPVSGMITTSWDGTVRLRTLVQKP